MWRRQVRETDDCRIPRRSSVALCVQHILTMDRISILALIALFVVAAEAQQCRDGWTYNGNLGSCYAIPTGAQGNWAEAMGYCASMSSELAVVESADEHNFLLQLVNVTSKNLTSDADFWIGAVDILEEGVYIWANRMTQLEYYFWGAGQPDNKNGRQGCLRMEHELGWQWGDGACGSTEYFICEREAEGR